MTRQNGGNVSDNTGILPWHNAPPDFVLISKYEDKILDIIYHYDDFTTSDLQGAIEAQLKMLIDEVKKSI
jgi:hypothetical protein